MRAFEVFFCFCVAYLLVITKETDAQFFTKTTNSIPRLGRSDQMPSLLPNLVRRVAKQLHFVIKMVNDNDKDGNGELNAEELMDSPFIQNAVKNELEARELRGQYLAPTGEATREEESDGNQRLNLEENFIM
ncbi:uncharacterized protein LOC129959106 isoform X1 [Argiope bruennichi]|uniref:EF-hand domain-containing protein n=1 Tax=Argiope bruennichi TaxID=94029 RepID=A0A8T0F1K0_ARGBR|nr:uncharacterized protein LOC129959106 isoform X1 [Argiope bruennichi]KAF8785004.1 hypothetical protein HNY73_010603 [Argiope bruennichi]